jgi:ribonuclease E
MTRQNVTDGPREILTVSCPTCAGNGVIVSPETHAVAAERELRRHVAGSKAEAFLVELHSEVARLLAGPGGSHLEELEKETGRRFAFKTKKSFRLDRFQVLAEGKASEIEGVEPRPEPAKTRAKRGGRVPAAVALEDAVLEDEPEAEEVVPADDGAPPAEEKPKKKTRRGTRGGRGRKKKPATAAATDGAQAAKEPEPEPQQAEPEPEPEPAVEAAGERGGNGDGTAEEKPKKKTRRGTRGGRRRRKKPAGEGGPAANGEGGESADEPIATAEEAG